MKRSASFLICAVALLVALSWFEPDRVTISGDDVVPLLAPDKEITTRSASVGTATRWTAVTTSTAATAATAATAGTVCSTYPAGTAIVAYTTTAGTL